MLLLNERMWPAQDLKLSVEVTAPCVMELDDAQVNVHTSKHYYKVSHYGVIKGVNLLKVCKQAIKLFICHLGIWSKSEELTGHYQCESQNYAWKKWSITLYRISQKWKAVFFVIVLLIHSKIVNIINTIACVWCNSLISNHNSISLVILTAFPLVEWDDAVWHNVQYCKQEEADLEKNEGEEWVSKHLCSAYVTL